MSKEKESVFEVDRHGYEYLEEHEWRIVYGYGNKDTGLIVETGGDVPPKYRIPFGPSDIQMLIIPDQEMRNQIVQAEHCQEIRAWFEGNLPAMITIEQLQHL